MVLYKSCPRCKGDMHINRDYYGEYKECLMCGLMIDIEKKDGLLAKALAGSKRKKVAKAPKLPKVAKIAKVA